MTEETDAVVVAVSEETGAISYAYKGQLTRGVSLEELRAFLTSVLVRAPKAHRLSDWDVQFVDLFLPFRILDLPHPLLAHRK